MSTTKYKAILPLTVISILLLNACAAGPTSRYMDGKWNVSENICSSDPANPELGDMRSEIRQHESYQSSYDRQITMFHRDRTILNVSQSFNRSGGSGSIDIYENSSANGIVSTEKIRHTRELNNMIEAGIEQFFENDPDIDGKEAESFCLYRGQ